MLYTISSNLHRGYQNINTTNLSKTKAYKYKLR